MSKGRIGIFWPLGPPVFAAAGLTIALVSFLRTYEMLSWPYQEWANTNGVFQRDAIDFSGPIAAALGALLSGRLTPPSRLYALPRFSRDSFHVVLRNILPASLTVSLGYLIALTPLVLSTQITATHGSLNYAAAAVGLLTLNACLVLGWWLGLVVQSAFVAPVAFALAFITVLIGYTGPTFMTVTPTLFHGAGVGVRESDALMLFRASFFAVVGTVAIVSASDLLTTRGFQRRLPTLRNLSLWLIPALFVVAGVVSAPRPIVREAGPPVCQDEGGMRYCVHQAHAKDLAALVDDVRPIVDLVGAENLPFDVVGDYALVRSYDQRAQAGFYPVDVLPADGVFGRERIADVVSGMTACFDMLGPARAVGQAVGVSGDTGPGGNAFSLNQRLMGRADADTGNPFGPLTDDELKAWLAEHRESVATCSITDDQLP